MGKAGTFGAGVAPGGSAHTTHITVADGDGNVVAATQTINSLFGSRAMVPDTGMLLNNTMAIFDPHPGHAMSVQPGKRMTSSMAPTIVLRDGRPALALGLPGGARIFTSVLQALVNVIDHGMSLQEAVEAPRMWTQGQELEVETAVGDDVRAGLARARPPRRAAGPRRRRHGRDRLRARRHPHRRLVLARRRHADRPRRWLCAGRHPLLAGTRELTRVRSGQIPRRMSMTFSQQSHTQEALMDRYTKIVLTVIAVALVVIAARPLLPSVLEGITPDAALAQAPPVPKYEQTP